MLDWLRKIFCSENMKTIEELESQIIEKDKEITQLNENLYKDNEAMTGMAKEILELEEKIKQLTAPKNPKEDETNNKYPKTNLTYLRHETDMDYQIDLRDFFMLMDNLIPIVGGKTDDEKALNGLKWVIDNIKYIPDKSDKSYKFDEYWAFPYQTLKHKQGDCEDGAILLANILVKSGIPYWKVRLSAGNVTGGGHAYVTYYCEEKNIWVILDWCYWPNILPINQRKDYKDETNYQDVWFSWNTKYCFTKGTKTNVNRYLNETGGKQKCQCGK